VPSVVAVTPQTDGNTNGVQQATLTASGGNPAQQRESNIEQGTVTNIDNPGAKPEGASGSEKQEKAQSAPSAPTANEANASYSEASEDFTDGVGSSENYASVESVRGKVGGRDKSIVDEWEKHMQNFVPEMLVTFPLAARSDEYFYEDVSAEPQVIRGGYFVSADEDQSDVDFQITDPSGDIIMKKTQSEGLFHFTTKMAGSYSFIISNHRWLQTKIITFAVGKGNATTLHPEHLTTLEQHLQSIDRSLRDIQSESTYLWIRQRSHMKAVQATNQKVFWLSLVEFVVLIVSSAFQVYYIKSLLSDRRIL